MKADVLCSIVMSGCFLKGEVHSKKLVILSLPITSKHSAFSLTDVSAAKVPANLKTCVSKKATSDAAILDCTLQQTLNWWEGEKPPIDFASFTRSIKSIFLYEGLSNSLSLLLSVSEFRPCLAQNNTASEQSQPFGQNHRNEPWLLSTVQTSDNDVEFWASLETNFITKTCTLEAKVKRQ